VRRAKSVRLAVIEAAARLFVERGYDRTSIDDVAVEAGVSRAAVFTAVGGKPALLKTAFDVAVVGDDEPVSLPERPRSRAVREEPDPGRYLAAYAGLMTEIDGRVSPIYEMVRGAIAGDPDARYLWDNHQAERRQAAACVVRDVREKGRLRDGLDEELAADIVWVLTDPGLYGRLVHQRKWPPGRFQGWLAETLQRQLLPDRPEPIRQPSPTGSAAAAPGRRPAPSR
jgi:AcrR family transcriptional regulator